MSEIIKVGPEPDCDRNGSRRDRCDKGPQRPAPAQRPDFGERRQSHCCQSAIKVRLGAAHHDSKSSGTEAAEAGSLLKVATAVICNRRKK
ncbi:hypothetical protein ACOI1H_22090 [Loktanella sp. DJP18]|uniref:hypothetical protein n=1 Tax=Loktanella sp. DJP18 TaxID=3409788 RepID=UPI003BB6FEF1